MCGIFGLFATKDISLGGRYNRLVRDLFLLSETRGKEAAGILVHTPEGTVVVKSPLKASAFLRSREYRNNMNVLNGGIRTGTVVLGQTRLATNGYETESNNNQPITVDKTIGVHNGIITNVDTLWSVNPDLKRHAEVDSEVIISLINRACSNGISAEPLALVLSELEGTASVATLLPSQEDLLLATNNGSLYIALTKDQQFGIFASEKYILTKLLRKFTNDLSILPEYIKQVSPGQGKLVNLSGRGIDTIEFQYSPRKNQSSRRKIEVASDEAVPLATRKRYCEKLEGIAKLRRCTKCVLPETIPLIDFDNKGVCNFCRKHRSHHLLGRQALEQEINSLCSQKADGDFLFLFSGGRDSSYALHYIVTELGIKPTAFTYDWGMVTPLARRNQARLCGQLGIEHIIVSADIREKRSNIALNLKAWLRRPELKMVPILMAGDKQYFYYARRVSEQIQTPLIISGGGNPLEKTGFKSGFAQIKEEPGHIYNMPLMRKTRLAASFAKEYFLNPSYLNRSLFDTLFAFYSAYLMPHNLLFFFDYIKWDEQLINHTLKECYNWESASDTDNTWRIGDGTAAFYNYIYHHVAGFTENDTFRSNQIRAEVITREEAMRRVMEDNQPRLETIREYLDLIGLGYEETMEAIEDIPSLY